MNEQTWLHDVLANVREHNHSFQEMLASGAANACPICQAQRIAILESQLKEAVGALEHIASYPVHSEPMGGALDMQDIASNALEKIKEGAK